MTKIEYLNKYSIGKVEIINKNSLANFDKYIPEKWMDILMQIDFKNTKVKVLEFWNSVVKHELSNTISYLENNLVSLDVLFDGKECSLIYGIRCDEANIIYYEGKFTLDLNKNIGLMNNWDDVPKEIKKFYQELHNGFYYYASHSMGLCSENDITYFADYDWEIVEQIKEPLQISLSSTFGFFTNGMGGYIAIDTKINMCNKAILWFKDKEPKYNLDFWNFVDEWIVIGFQN